MKRIDRFSLERHEGPYESWPLRSRLLDRGAPTRLTLPGFQIDWQLELDDGYLFVTDYDCPFEEMFEILLVSSDLRLISRATDPPRLLTIFAVGLGAISASAANLYCDCEIVDERTVRLIGCRPPHLRVEILECRPLGMGSRLRLVHEA